MIKLPIIATSLLFIVSCSSTVTPAEFSEATKRCEPHGGLLEYVSESVADETYVGMCRCVDGTVIQGRQPNTK